MKACRVLGGLLISLGCVMALIGFLALILPCVNNEQIQLFVSSFSDPSTNPIVSAINQIMTFSYTYSWQMVAVGAAGMLVGVWLLIGFSDDAQTPKKNDHCPPVPPIKETPIPVVKDNPFAVATFDADFQTMNGAMSEAAPASLRFAPILSENANSDDNSNSCVQFEVSPSESEAVLPVIEPAQTSAYVLAAEIKATETKVDAPSQSGSRIILRPIAAPDEMPEHSTTVVPIDKRPSIPEPISPIAPSGATLASNRIRSTIGKHRT